MRAGHGRDDAAAGVDSGPSLSTPTSGSTAIGCRTFDALLDTPGPRPTVLTYEDWSSLAWYETGVGTVAVVPPGYAKLAFDPAVFTDHGQAERRSDLADALCAATRPTWSRRPISYGADRIVLARRGPTRRAWSASRPRWRPPRLA